MCMYLEAEVVCSGIVKWNTVGTPHPHTGRTTGQVRARPDCFLEYSENLMASLSVQVSFFIINIYFFLFDSFLCNDFNYINSFIYVSDVFTVIYIIKIIPHISYFLKSQKRSDHCAFKY